MKIRRKNENKARENESDQITIGFRTTYDLFRSWCVLSYLAQSQTKEEQNKQTQIICDTQLKFF